MTSLSPTKLSHEVDALVAQNLAVLVETPEHVILSGLSAENARHVGQLTRDLVWAAMFEDGAEAECEIADLGEDLAPYRVRIDKPPAPAETVRLLTCAGFAQWLEFSNVAGRIEVCPASANFTTYGFTVSAWGAQALPPDRPEIKSPRKLVREAGSARIVPDDIRPWLLDEKSEPLWRDRVFQTWAIQASVALSRALSSEIMDEGETLVFSGPPKLQTKPGVFDWDRDSDRDGFGALQAAARWVFENDREVETRHRLMAMEVARSASSSAQIPVIFTENTVHLLEGARLAFQMGLEDLSKDTIKALTDLRKSLADETSKLADGMRQIATSVAGALFAGLGLIVARVSASAPPKVIVPLAGIIFCFVVAIIFSNIQYVYIQRDIRKEWRGRIYRFLNEDDYNKMVTVPADKAENALFIAMTIGGAITLAMLGGIILTS